MQQWLNQILRTLVLGVLFMTSTPASQTSLSYESPGLKHMFFLFRVSFGRLRIKDFRAWHLEPPSS